VKGRVRVALVLVAIVFCAAGQIATAHSTASARAGEPRGSSLTVSTGHQDSAIVPASALVRGGRAIGPLLSVPLADLLALVSLLALWFTSSVRRRERLAHAVVTYPRRGPPLLTPVD
jgi:hypothetical protein